MALPQPNMSGAISDIPNRGRLSRKIRVLIVDDSASVRQSMKAVLESDSMVEVMGTAQDPFAAVERIGKEVPDVITLDVEMPKMDGITFLKRLMAQRPIPVVVCSSLTEEGSATALAALENGAVEIITKPQMNAKGFIEESALRICDAVKAAAAASHRLRRIGPISSKRKEPVPKKQSADIIMSANNSSAMIQTTEKVIVVGASTGGTEALRVLLEALPANAPGICIVQHMPEKFTAQFASRLDQCCQIQVKEAVDNDSVIPGRALIAPGNKHMLLKRSGARYYVTTNDGPLVNRHRPAVDVLFRSASRYAGSNVVGVILTGMGDDGARGMVEMKKAGAHNIAQDENTCVVYGMPHEAVKLGGVNQVLPLEKIASEVVKLGRI